MKLHRHTAAAIARQRNFDDYKAIVSGIADYGEELVQRMISPNAENRDFLAGQAAAVTEILKALSTEPEKLDQIIGSNRE